MQPDGGLRIAIAIVRARKARSCFMRLLIAQPTTRRDVEGMIAVRGALELSASDDLDAVLAHQATNSTLSDMNAQLIQLLGPPWSTVAAQAQAVLIADMGQEHQSRRWRCDGGRCFQACRPRSETRIRRHRWLRVSTPRYSAIY